MTLPTLETAYATLRADPRVEADLHDGRIDVRRRRIAPRRGLFRLIIPHVTARVRRTSSALVTRVRPDAVGVFMVIVLLGGVVVELTMNRARYPRSYPPAFVYGLTAFYVALFVIEALRTHRLVSGVLERLRVTKAFE